MAKLLLILILGWGIVEEVTPPPEPPLLIDASPAGAAE